MSATQNKRGDKEMFEDFDRAYNDYMATDYEKDIMERDDCSLSIGAVEMGKFTAPYQVDYISYAHHFG